MQQVEHTGKRQRRRDYLQQGADYQKLTDIPGEERAAGFEAFENTSDLKKRIRLWDNAEMQWTSQTFEETEILHRVTLRKIGCKCSACIFWSETEKGFFTHMKQVSQRGETHEDATLESFVSHGESRWQCSGCGATFQQGKKLAAQRHIEVALSDPARHETAKPITMRRFSLDMPENYKKPEPVVSVIEEEEGFDPWSM